MNSIAHDLDTNTNENVDNNDANVTVDINNNKDASFETFNLPDVLKQTLEQLGFSTPTPVQAEALPIALAGKDILGSAQTGTGKTGAFGIPLIARIIENPQTRGLILAPTRELATQVAQFIQKLIGFRNPAKIAVLIGGEPMFKQFKQLKAKPSIIIGTPGRINDHLERGSLILKTTNYVVLDETDRMLDMGFGIQLEAIFKYLPTVRQTLMFSATLPPAIVKMSAQYLHNPERIAIGATNAIATNIKQETLYVSGDAKYPALIDQLQKRQGSIIIFAKTKQSVEELADRLCQDGYEADAIHGDLQQRQRERVIASFRAKRYQILVATDVASRGIDIPHIAHVINFDLPQCPEDYIHRIGRTARAGAEGEAVSFIAPEEGGKWRAIYRLLYPNEKPPYIPGKAGGRGGDRRSSGGGRGGDRRSSAGGGRSSGGGFGEKRRSFGGSAGGASGGSERKFGGGDRKFSSDRPERSFDRPERADRPERSFDRPERAERSFDRADRPERSFDRPERTERSDRPFERASKPFAPRGDSEKKPENRFFGKREEGGNRFEGSREGGNRFGSAPREGNRFDSSAPRGEGRQDERRSKPFGASTKKPFAKGKDSFSSRGPKKEFSSERRHSA